MLIPVVEQFDIGNGVDSRSNPLNMPRNRALRMRNFAPPDNNVLQLRYGFSTVTMSGSTSTASFNSLIPYTLYDASGNETPELILHQGTALLAMNILTGAVTAPSVRGTAIASTASFASYLANGKVHMGNGTDQKWFDGTTFRDNGLRALTAAEVSSVAVIYGIGEWTTEASTATATATGTTGTFSATVGTGLFFYGVYFDTTTNEVGPASNHIGSARVTMTTNQKVSLANLPNVSATFPTLIKLIARTNDGADGAYFCTNTSTTITSCARITTTLTVTTSGAHGLSSNDVVILSNTTNFDSVYLVTVTGANTFTVILNLTIGHNTSGANTTGGTCKRIISVAAATTTQDITSPATDTTWLVNDANRGIIAPTSSVTSPGYQFYACIYNPSGGGHVGNRIAIGGGRLTMPRRINVYISGLPDLSGIDSEWQLLIGRTGDGGQLPYPCADSSGNWLTTVSGQTVILAAAHGGLDGTNELPTRNGVIPAGLNMFALFGGKIAGAISGRPTVYLSADEADDLQGDFVGRPEQSWAPNDIETFPTAQGLTGMFDEDRGVFCATKNDGAILADLGPKRGWIGPWYGAGMAGIRAKCDTPYGKFWVTGHKQLVTMDNGAPVAVSDEYQTALLSKIGDAYLSTIEMKHIQDVAKSIDHILIKCRDTDGRPYEVIHDFKLRDGASPQGQGYEFAYSSPLSTTDFVLTKVRDSAGAERLWAGASTGQLYQLHSGANDAGTEYSADAIFLLNAGPDRIGVPEIRWYGDQKAIVSRGLKLKSSVATGAEFAFEQITPSSGGLEVDGGQDDYQYKTSASSSEPIKHAYLRFQLTSHSSDGNLNLNDPPHVPLENYGRIYVTQALIEKAQGA